MVTRVNFVHLPLSCHLASTDSAVNSSSAGEKKSKGKRLNLA